MPLAFHVDSLDAVPEAHKEHYVAYERGFHLDLIGNPDTDGLLAALRAERQTNKAFKRVGFTADQPAMQQLEHLLNQREAQHSQEKAALQSELDATRASERDAIVNATLATALANARATPEGIDLLLDRLGKRVVLKTVDGARVVSIMASDGKTPMEGSTGAATFADLVADAVKSFPSLFEGRGIGGSGTSPRQAPSPSRTITRREFETLSPLERQAKVRAGIQIVD